MTAASATLSQSGVIPYRIRADVVEILLVDTRSGTGLTIPKGHIKEGLSASQSAIQEAYEEAGVRGRLFKPRVGGYEYRKRAGRYRVKVFLMEVTETTAAWPEDHFRSRRWMPIDQAVASIKYEGLAALLETARHRIAELTPRRLPSD